MPYSVYIQLGLHDLKPTSISLLLADRSTRYPRGIIEDILIQVDKLIISTDFVVLDIDDEKATYKDLSILLRRPFIATAKTIIDVQNGKLSMIVLDKTDELKDLLELERKLGEIQCLGNVGAKDGPETDLGVDEKKHLQAKAQPCLNKPCRPKPNLEESVCEEELKLLKMGDMDPMEGDEGMWACLAGYAADIILDVH
ncbi:hypothetical protein ACOSQ2_021422 [Xanthoceras sorbifolium]